MKPRERGEETLATLNPDLQDSMNLNVEMDEQLGVSNEASQDNNAENNQKNQTKRLERMACDHSRIPIGVPISITRSDAEKARIGKERIAEIHARLITGVPLTAAYFQSENSSGYD